MHFKQSRLPALLGLIVLLAAAPGALAATPGHEAAAATLLRTLGVDKGVEPIAARLRDGAGLRSLIDDVPEDQRAIAEGYLDEIGELVATEMSWAALEDDFIDIYTSLFSEAELVQINTFFSSEAGATYLAQTGTLNQAASNLLRSRALELAPRIRAITEAMNEALEPATP